MEKFSLFFSILRSPAILRSRILRHKASALRLGQFSNFWEKLLKNLYSLMVTDMRRCILARVGSAVLALSPFVTISKEEKGKEAKERGFHCTVFSFLFFLAVKIVDSHAACCHCTTLHFTTLHCNALESLASTRRTFTVTAAPRTRLDSFTAYASTVHGACKTTKQISLTIQQRTEQRSEQRDESSPSPSPNEAHNGAYEQCCSCRRLRLLLLFFCGCCYLFLANGLLFLFSLLFAVVF